MKEYRYIKEASTVKILGEPNRSIPLSNWGKEVVEESRMMEKTPREDLITAFHKIQRPFCESEKPPRPKLYPPPIASPFMKGTETATTKRNGRMIRTFFARWANGSLDRKAIPIRASANRLNKGKASGEELTAIKMNVKKTRIFALASR
jgi:hypothetical protein